MSAMLQAAPAGEPYKPPTKRQRTMSAMDDRRLIKRCDEMVARWEKNEAALRARDRKGYRMWLGEAWRGGGLLEARSSLEINSESPAALFDRVAADVLRGIPEPEIEATNDDEDDAARVAQGALRANWRDTKFQDKLAQAYRLAGFTRPVAMYYYWRSEALGGLGDVDSRMIPAHRFIVDDRSAFTRDMKYVGFWEEMPRGDLIRLFPDKAEAIEDATSGVAQKPHGIETDPLRSGLTASGTNAKNASVDRLISATPANVGPYTAATSIKTPSGKAGHDAMKDDVKVRFLWIEDQTPMTVQKPRLDPRTKQPLYELTRNELGVPQLDDDGAHEVIDTPLGPQYVPQLKPKFDMVMEDHVVQKYRYWRHVAYVPEDKLVLWDVAWDGPVPLAVLRDRYPAYGFDAAGSALRLATLAIARNIMWTIIFERLRKSLAGTFITTSASGLVKNRLMNEVGSVFTLKGNASINDAIKEFPQTPLEASNFQLLDKIEAEMEMLLGVTPTMKGQALGRADNAETYQQVEDQSGGPILDRAKLVDTYIADSAEITLWFQQAYYTHEHTVEFETAEGFSTWTEASSLVMRGKLAVRVTTGSTLGHNRSRDRQEAKDAMGLGIYPLPMYAKVSRTPFWRAGMKQREAIMRMGPEYAWMLGAAGAPPAAQAANIRATTNRSHHKAGTGK